MGSYTFRTDGAGLRASRAGLLLALLVSLRAGPAKAQPAPGHPDAEAPGPSASAPAPVAPPEGSAPESPAAAETPPAGSASAEPAAPPAPVPPPPPVEAAPSQSAAEPEETAPTDAESSPSPTPPAEIHGFVSQGFIKSTKNNYLADSKRGSFDFTEAGVNVTSNPVDNLRVGIQLFAHDLGPLGNYRPRFDWFYLDYRFRDWLGLRAGRTKIPFGLYNESNDIDSARVPILLPQSVYPIQNRDFLLAQTGSELYGTVNMGGAGDLEYRAYGGTLFLDPADTQNTLSNTSVPFLFGGRLMWQTPIEGLQVGGSMQKLRLDGDYAPSPADIPKLQAAGTLPAGFAGTAKFRIHALLGIASLEYAAHDLLLATEYARWRARAESDVATLVPKELTVSERLYVMGSYRLSPWFVPGVYYSLLFSDVDARRTPGKYQHDVAGTLRFDVNPHWLWKLEGHFMHGTAALSSALNDNVPLGYLPLNWGVFLIKTTAYF